MKTSFVLFFYLLLSVSGVAAKTYPMVFVHGAHFSGDSFNLLIKEFKGDARAINLPNGASSALTVTLTDYAKAVCKILKSKSILIGHSQGGAVINHALGICPEKIKALVFMAATIPLSGEKPFALFGPQNDEYYFKAIEEDKEKGLFVIKDREAFLDAFISDGSDPQKFMVEKISHDEPVAPSNTEVSFDVRRFQEMKKLVFFTAYDRVISPMTQEAYVERLDNAKVIRLESGHLPMITKTQQLHEEIEKFAATLDLVNF